MNKTLSFFLLASAALLAPLAHAAPVSAPKLPASMASACAPRHTLLDYYDALPGSEFAGFGGKNRRSLLKRKGAIVDAKRGFIEIPGSGDLSKLQISLFGQGESLVAVSRVMKSLSKKTGTLHFYDGYADASPSRMRTAAKTTFPFAIPKGNNAFLPRKGTTITIASREDADAPPRYNYRPGYGAGQSAFARKKS